MIYLSTHDMKISYSWEETETLWQSRYETLAQEAGISSDTLRASRAQLLVAFGEVWLKQEYEKSKKTSKPLHEMLKPSLVGMLSNPVINNAVQIVELAKYLTVLRDQEKLNETLTMLKAQFEAARLNIAVAYRLHKVGFEELSIEPDSPRGKGDVKGKFLNVPFFFECSIIEEKNLEFLFQSLLEERLSKGMKDQALQVGFEVEFVKAVDATGINETVEAVKQARHIFGKQEKLFDTPFKSSVARGKVFRLQEEHKKSPPDMEKWDAVFSLSYETPVETRNIYTIDLDVPHNATGRLFIKGLHSAQQQKSMYERMKAKLEEKIVQTHNVPDKKIFVIMTEKRIEGFSWKDIWKSMESNLKTRPNIAGVFFVDRRQTELDGKMRFAYPLAFFVNIYGDMPELHPLFENLKKLERSDWLAA